MSPRFFGSETYCFGDGGPAQGSTGSGGNHPIDEEQADSGDYITYYIDCNGDIDGSAVIDYNCGCILGNKGIQSCAQKVYLDTNTRQCLKDIKTKLEMLGMKNSSMSTGLISKVLNSLNLSTGRNFNAIITEGLIMSGAIAETTFTNNLNSWGPSGYVSQIKFNETYLNKSTDLKIAATMMHEYIHAYFDWNIYLIRSGQVGSDENFEKNYVLLFDKSGTPLPDSYGNAAQHEQIATSFVSEMATMLRNYAVSQNIALPVDTEFFKKMAWGGLKGTSLYKFAPNGTEYTLAAESGNGSATITQILNCKKL